MNDIHEKKNNANFSPHLDYESFTNNNASIHDGKDKQIDRSVIRNNSPDLSAKLEEDSNPLELIFD
ncbi:hypothetical protein HZS_8159 [Henneguya salminicola]|nr:hypothetical protein HZS_8159 [Henneguya salminicola]